jgi:tRNA (cmo5U34)-methyltransferase
VLSTQPSTASSLGHLPRGDRWAFDDSVTGVFADMLRRSIPQYEVMRQSVFDVGRRFVRPSTQIVDLGCSRGDAMAPFVAAFGADNCHVGIDTSEPMLKSARERFAAEIGRGYVRLSGLDLRSAFPHGETSLTLCVLTLQFTPIEYRRQILRQVFRNTIPGGAVIVVEKVLGNGPVVGPLLVNLYHDLKAANGYSHEEIERKRLSLEGVLVPVTAHWNEDLLVGAGFEEVECFWRWMNFAAWVAVKPEP